MPSVSLSPAAQNALTLKHELEWLRQVIDHRFALYFEQDGQGDDLDQLPPPDLQADASIYADIVRHFQMSAAERLVLALALAPHVVPQLLDCFFVRNEQFGRGFSEFGGIKGQQHSGFLPTGETAAFLLAANDLSRRFTALRLFDEGHFFHQQKILTLERSTRQEPLLSGALVLSSEYLNYFTTGTAYQPRFSSEFPAQRIATELTWDDLVLEPNVMDEVREILAWLQHKDTLLADARLGRKLKPGYRALFYGPPGTGKTLTATILGRETGLAVYRVDLSKVVSKYIGETEKNMANIFDQAENKQWILFFDEADALFGKRTNTTDAKDRHANQEVAYLLQRVEEFPGVVILASNLKANLDEAFIRRFQSMVFFPMPKARERLKLWQSAFPAQCEPAPQLDLRQIAEAHEMAGGAINNVMLHCALRALVRGDKRLYQEDLEEEIRREFKKEGKTV